MTTTEDIETAAKALGIDLLPWQCEYATAALNGENVAIPGGQKVGRLLVEAVINEVHRRRARQSATAEYGAQTARRNELAGIVATVMDEHGLFAPLSTRYAIADAILAAGYSKAPNHPNGGTR